MQPIRVLVAKLMSKEDLSVIAKISLLILWVLSACSPAALPATPVDSLVAFTEEPATPTTVLPAQTIEVTPSSTSTPEPEEQVVHPYYLPLATKPNLEPQTINGVTAQINWVYVDESRVALHYTISGLDWPDGTQWDAMSVKITSTATTPALPPPPPLSSAIESSS